MIALFLLIFLAVLSWVFASFFHNHGWLSGDIISSILGSIFSIALFITILLIADKNNDDKNFHEKRQFYAYVAENFEDASKLGDASRVVPFSAIEKMMKEAEDINRRISLNRKYCESPFIGLYFSKNIANEEFIKIPNLQVSNFIITHE